jgi:hypothetical protein
MDAGTRKAALTATLVALPVAVVTALGVGVLHGGHEPRESSSTVAARTPGPVSTAPVDVSAPAGPLAAPCQPLMPALPPVLDRMATRQVRPDSPAAHAWGDPAIVLRCGVGKPVDLTPTADLLDINGVSWLPVVGLHDVVWTTTDRGVYIEVAVPKQYDGRSGPITDLSNVIAATVPKTG